MSDEVEEAFQEWLQQGDKRVGPTGILLGWYREAFLAGWSARGVKSGE